MECDWRRDNASFVQKQRQISQFPFPQLPSIDANQNKNWAHNSLSKTFPTLAVGFPRGDHTFTKLSLLAFPNGMSTARPPTLEGFTVIRINPLEVCYPLSSENLSLKVPAVGSRDMGSSAMWKNPMWESPLQITLQVYFDLQSRTGKILVHFLMVATPHPSDVFLLPMTHTPWPNSQRARGVQELDPAQS